MVAPTTSKAHRCRTRHENICSIFSIFFITRPAPVVRISLKNSSSFIYFVCQIVFHELSLSHFLHL